MNAVPSSPSASARAPGRVRDLRLDVARGWMQLTIFASHASGSWIGAWLIFGSWGLSDSSEQFVLLSGFTLGSVFARRSAARGWRSAARDMWMRTARLYRTHFTVFLLFALLAVSAGAFMPGEAERLGWSFLLDHPLQAIPAALIGLYQPALMGILPIFMWCMLALPMFAALQGRAGDWALCVPIGLYACVRLFGLAAPSLEPGGGIAFNPFAWQLLFLFGAWLGRRALLQGTALPRSHWSLAVALSILLTGLALRLGWYGWLPWPAPVAEGALTIGKEDLALPRLLHALALAWVVAALVPRHARWMETVIGRALAAMGRHSLHVFCLGLFLSWAASAAFRLLPGRWWLDPLLIGSGAMLLAFAALRTERARQAARLAIA